MERLGKETIVLFVVAIPALVASVSVVVVLKTTCGLLWHSSCQARMSGVHPLDESVQISHLHPKRSKIRPAAMGN